MSQPGREANLLGAFALVVADRTSARAGAAAGQSLSGAAALSALRHFLSQPTVDQLRRTLGLTPSGAVRLVDRLAQDGLVTRGPGFDGRSRSIVLTRKGRKVADRITRARMETLGGVMEDLSPGERHTLNALVSRMMVTIVGAKQDGAWICRLCDTTACGRDAGLCPTANAAAAKYELNSS
jgi:DNA-binding MarR family transcriptional regulator